MRKLLDVLIRIQSAVPFVLPNERLAWRQYQSNFTKTCDICHDEKGVYKITVQNPTRPWTVLMPVPVRMCTECVCEADEKVGIMSNKDEEGGSIKFERV